MDRNLVRVCVRVQASPVPNSTIMCLLCSGARDICHEEAGQPVLHQVNRGYRRQQSSPLGRGVVSQEAYVHV
jgi:hypothetical protein